MLGHKQLLSEWVRIMGVEVEIGLWKNEHLDGSAFSWAWYATLAGRPGGMAFGLEDKNSHVVRRRAVNAACVAVNLAVNGPDDLKPRQCPRCHGLNTGTHKCVGCNGLGSAKWPSACQITDPHLEGQCELGTNSCGVIHAEPFDGPALAEKVPKDEEPADPLHIPGRQVVRVGIRCGQCDGRGRMPARTTIVGPKCGMCEDGLRIVNGIVI